MSASRVVASKNGRNKASVDRRKEHRAFRASKVLAERNPAVVAVGAWVEDGHDFLEHPNSLALLTEELQAEKRREKEESLRRFQDEVRHRVAQRAQVFKKRQQPHTHPVVTPDRSFPQQHYQVWTHSVSAGERLMSGRAAAAAAAQHRVMEKSSEEWSGGMRQVRLRLAACRMIPHEETTSELPGGRWNISPTRHKAESHVLEGEEEGLEEEEEEEGGDSLLISQHECPLVQQKVVGRASWNPDKLHPDPVLKSKLGAPRVLWPLNDQEELKRQRQSQFLMHRRLVMSNEREQVKENKQHRKHLKRTARIKAEKEQIRLEEERRLERDRQLAEARQKLEERELLILERLKLEEEERAVELQRRKREDKGKVAARFIDALRAQMKERLSQAKLDLPPLCCCASSFWDSHPDTCANNCVFHNNPKAYAQALHSTMVSLDLQ
ncbi:coiled-coil domain-containing protein 15 [Stegastes partitus]|uniref:Coiled-coil domain-containing protein 15 n=1 Tax=Stegastes partitus TaxID=144197 RepID=A0A9Y4K079_9TELE|nr:PREDICTED: coiled-coil domain-containing protein 15 [Stegastes partitus]